MLCTYAAYYTVIILWDCSRWKSTENIINETPTAPLPSPKAEKLEKPTKVGQQTVLVHETVLRSLFAYDNSNHKSMAHIRFDANTIDLINKFKMATGVENTKLVAFSVKYLFETNPELKTIIKQFIQNTEL
ncbi:MAG: hypothetical protein JWR09_722 [Mucilaginibacter sp.]|nr:hypothetical protein [Mucilaginibacter sp.]